MKVGRKQTDIVCMITLQFVKRPNERVVMYMCVENFMKRRIMIRIVAIMLWECIDSYMTQVSVVNFGNIFNSFEKNLSDFEISFINSWISLLNASEISSNNS